MALMSRLLDEALALDAAGRRLWLERLSPEYQDLVQYLREALLPGDSQAAQLVSLSTLPKLGAADPKGCAAASGLKSGARVGPYELIRLLGAGGMAEVWLARRADGAFNREVALKLPMLTNLRADLEQRFSRERDILASLEHPLIARLYDAGIDPAGLPYLAMEYVQGQPLTSWCDAHRLGIAARLELILQVLEAVQYAHEKHIVHRDLKPSNVLVTESGQVRLLDFGVSKLLGAIEEGLTQLTNVYGRALTPDYDSPELLHGGTVDARSDIYSLGVLLYEMLTGVRPYRLKSAASIGMLEQAIATVEVKNPSSQREPEASEARNTTPDRLTRQLRGDLDAIALKALHREPSKRYQSAAAFAEDIERYLARRPIQALPGRITDRVYKFALRNSPAVAVAAMALAAIIVAVGYTIYRESAPRATLAASATALPVSAQASTPPTTIDASTAAAAAAAERSVAVLPFVDMSEKRDQEYFSDGLSEELIELLGETPGLRVIARTSSFYFKGRAEKLETIAAELRVANILEGSVRKSGNRLRVTAQLIRVDTSEHLWSETFDRDLHDVFKVQDEIASAVVTALRVHLLPTQPAARDELRTGNLEAYYQYLQGRQSYNQGNAVGYQRAVIAFQAATTLDPRYAAAYADLALAQFWATDTTDRGETAADVHSALAAAEKAVALAPGLAAGYSARGFLRAIYSFDFPGAQADLDKAVALSPSDAWVLHRSAVLLAVLGKLPEAIAREDQALALDPLSTEICMRLAFFLVANGQLSQARPLYEKALAIAPHSTLAHYHLAELELLENQPERALAAFRQTGEEQFSLTGQAKAEYSLRHVDASQRVLEQLIASRSLALNYFALAPLGSSAGLTYVNENGPIRFT